MPIPYREILLTARIMDMIFDQLRDQVPISPQPARRMLIWPFKRSRLPLKMAEPAMKP